MAPMTVDVAMDMKETVSTLAQVITPKFHIILVFHGRMDCKMNSLIISIATFFERDWSSGGNARFLYALIPRPVSTSRYIKSLCDFASSLTFCVNTDGSYDCSCLPGYTGNGMHDCLGTGKKKTIITILFYFILE